ncbi:adenosine kinase [Sphingomonas astaxanthinifaciens]|uniref:Adenosine kinase n=1 Tax=Sphingomonas astaxanthinifaciens DSM 22298 TaxID=1123267 RepID=A0ABQ5Z707_9SPHN|nr:adenosine kinase [Sphingomonas astaxanthinifaciens]GLR46372.1 adenosine kinase [Sphingomonas astaxanthinifaciens DSM 22298]
MTSATLDILAMGDALVDVIATCEPDFLERFALPKGAMQLLGESETLALYDAMGTARETSGGSAANSMAGAAAMGASVAFLGQVADDQLGTIFTHDMRALGVRFDTAPLQNGPPTGRCLILVTPDGERTMNTCPGAAHCLPPQAVDEAQVRSASILYLEGYLFGPELPRQAMFKAIDIAHAADRTVAFTLSESVCLPGRKEPLQQLIAGGGIDLIFANESEALQLAGATDLDSAIDRLSAQVKTLVFTRGPAGALAYEDGQKTEVPAIQVAQVVDTTGAGDLFAAGFLAARCKGHPIDRQLLTGGIAAAEIISHFGARPVADLAELVKL